MDRSFVRMSESISRAQAEAVVGESLNWILVETKEGDEVRAALNPRDLAAFLSETESEDDDVHLLEIPGQRMDVTYVEAEATANEAAQALLTSEADVCCIRRTTAPMIKPIIGIVTQSHLENYRTQSA